MNGKIEYVLIYIQAKITGILAEQGVLHKKLGDPEELNAWRYSADDSVCVKRKERGIVFTQFENKTHQDHIKSDNILVRLRVLEDD